MKCIKCGEEIINADDDDLFCQLCKSVFNEQPTVVHNFQYKCYSAEGWMCPKCSRILSPWTIFCPFCTPEMTWVTTTTEIINNIKLVNEDKGDCDE